jgi:hypothetical protein
MNTILTLPQISIDEITLIKEYDRWDGPTCGIVAWNHKQYYFNWMDRIEGKYHGADDDARVFAMYEMTDDQLVYFSNMEDHWDLLHSIDLDWDKFVEKFYSKFPSSSWPQFKDEQAVAWFTGL